MNVINPKKSENPQKGSRVGTNSLLHGGKNFWDKQLLCLYCKSERVVGGEIDDANIPASRAKTSYFF